MKKSGFSGINSMVRSSLAIAALAMTVNFSLPAVPAQADILTGVVGGGLVGGIIGGGRGAVAGVVVGGIAGAVVEDNKRRNKGGRRGRSGKRKR